MAVPPGNGRREGRDPTGTVSIPFLVLAAVLIGAGIFLVFSWLLTFQWVYFGGTLLLAVGALMLFSPRTGPNETL